MSEYLRAATDLIGTSLITPMTAILTKKCSRCGAPFGCQQESGCWCAGIRLAPATLAELRTRFAECLCEACLREFALEREGAVSDQK